MFFHVGESMAARNLLMDGAKNDLNCITYFFMACSISNKNVLPEQKKKSIQFLGDKSPTPYGFQLRAQVLDAAAREKILCQPVKKYVIILSIERVRLLSFVIDSCRQLFISNIVFTLFHMHAIDD